jgi:hypothetical protein
MNRYTQDTFKKHLVAYTVYITNCNNSFFLKFFEKVFFGVWCVCSFFLERVNFRV